MMKFVKYLSIPAFYLTRGLSIVYALTSIYVILSIVLKLPTYELLDADGFSINYPFVGKPFLLGSSNSFAYITEMISLVSFYAAFFCLLSYIFKVFRQDKLFTEESISYLKRFYMVNLILCPILFIVLSVYSIENLPYFLMAMAHIIMGIFVLFIAAIFEQGVHLQKDQDLYI